MAQQQPAQQTGDVPMLDTGDLYAEWDAEDGVIRLYNGRSASGELAYNEAHIVSPMEVQQIAAWMRKYKLS